MLGEFFHMNSFNVPFTHVRVNWFSSQFSYWNCGRAEMNWFSPPPHVAVRECFNSSHVQLWTLQRRLRLKVDMSFSLLSQGLDTFFLRGPLWKTAALS